MIEIGDIYYAKKGMISSSVDGIPIIIFSNINGHYQVRYQEMDKLTHNYWNMTEENISQYFERNK